MKKVTRNNINKNNLVALGYCQCQEILSLFGYGYKVGYNSGVYGWNYDVYRINNIDIVTGYNVPYAKYSNKYIKSKLIELENKVRKNKDYTKNKEFKKEFFRIFE